jgi:hypothetical protein
MPRCAFPGNRDSETARRQSHVEKSQERSAYRPSLAIIAVVNGRGTNLNEKFTSINSSLFLNAGLHSTATHPLALGSAFGAGRRE